MNLVTVLKVKFYLLTFTFVKVLVLFLLLLRFLQKRTVRFSCITDVTPLTVSELLFNS